jgi:hypothetical protein
MNFKNLIEKFTELAKLDEAAKTQMVSQIKIIYDDILARELPFNFIIPKNDNKNRKYYACAVDGSKYEVEINDLVLVIAKVVKIKGAFNEKRSIPDIINEDFRIVGNYFGIPAISNKSLLLMISLETEMIEKCQECDVIFIDGPIVEPPTYFEDIKIKEFPNLEDIINYRSKVINNLRNKIIIGLVKNFYHRFLINELINFGYRKLINARETYIISHLFLKYRKNNNYKGPLALGWIDWEKIATKTLEDLKGISKVYNLYKNNMELKIISAYLQLSELSPIVRIDLTVSNDKVEEKFLNFILDWGIETSKEVTLLSKLADELSTITYRDVLRYIKLFDYIRNKNLEDKIIEKIMNKKLKL